MVDMIDGYDPTTTINDDDDNDDDIIE